MGGEIEEYSCGARCGESVIIIIILILQKLFLFFRLPPSFSYLSPCHVRPADENKARNGVYTQSDKITKVLKSIVVLFFKVLLISGL